MLGRKSSVWSFFTRISNSDCSCNLCGKVYKSSGNTTNVRTHLRNKHPSAYEASFSTVAVLPRNNHSCEPSEIEVKPDLPHFADNVGNTGHASEDEEICTLGTPRKKKKKVVKELLLQQVLEKMRPQKNHKDDYFGSYVSAQLLTFPPLESDKLKMEIHTLIYNRRLELENWQAQTDSYFQPSRTTSPSPPQVVQLTSSQQLATNSSTPKSLPPASTVPQASKCISNKYREHASSIAKSSSYQPLLIASPSQSPKPSPAPQTSSLSKILQLSPNQSNSYTPR